VVSLQGGVDQRGPVGRELLPPQAVGRLPPLVLDRPLRQRVGLLVVQGLVEPVVLPPGLVVPAMESVFLAASGMFPCDLRYSRVSCRCSWYLLAESSKKARYGPVAYHFALLSGMGMRVGLRTDWSIWS